MKSKLRMDEPVEALKRDALKRRFESAATCRRFQSADMSAQSKHFNGSTIQHFNARQ